MYNTIDCNVWIRNEIAVIATGMTAGFTPQTSWVLRIRRGYSGRVRAAEKDVVSCVAMDAGMGRVAKGSERMTG